MTIDIIALAKEAGFSRPTAVALKPEFECLSALLEAEIRKEFDEEKREASENMLLLIADVRYVAGIAERGRGKPLEDGEKFTQVVLDYVKSLEAQNAKLMEALEKVNKYLKANAPLELHNSIFELLNHDAALTPQPEKDGKE